MPFLHMALPPNPIVSVIYIDLPGFQQLTAILRFKHDLSSPREVSTDSTSTAVFMMYTGANVI